MVMPQSFLDWIDRRRAKKQAKAAGTLDTATASPAQQSASAPQQDGHAPQDASARQAGHGGHQPAAAGAACELQRLLEFKISWTMLTHLQRSDSEVERSGMDHGPVRLFTPRLFAMAIIVSIGGMIFGYDTGQISGFLAMTNFRLRFGDATIDGKPGFTDSRSGTIVGLLSIGTLIGAIAAAPIANAIGRKKTILIGNVIFIIGVLAQIFSQTHWYQIAVGRWVAGLGVGVLSVLTPMYQSESAPRQVRGALVSAYQLFITLGIFTADGINYGTATNHGSSQWRIPMGIGFIWPVIMMVGILFLPESPRWDYRHGRIEQARTTIAKNYGVSENHWEVHRELREIKEKFDAEGTGKHPWYEVFTAPRMFYRVMLGVVLQMLQQLTGANLFFYYGTTIFQATGINNSFVTAMILGGINFGMTFPGLYIVEHYGRRRSLIAGAIWMSMCFFIYASVGHFALDRANPQSTEAAGTALIVFASLFIAGFAPTWGPIVWTVIGEMYPSRYRALAIGLATASNWTWNFLIAFFTPFITNDIDFRYGYVFASCNLVGAVVVYFFLCESQGRTLEEIDTMYLSNVSPLKSSKWVPPPPEEMITTEKMAAAATMESALEPRMITEDMAVSRGEDVGARSGSEDGKPEESKSDDEAANATAAAQDTTAT